MAAEEAFRLFKEFYPDAEQRHSAHYLFAYRFIGPYVFQNPFAFFSYLHSERARPLFRDPTTFLHSRWEAIFEREFNLQPVITKPGAFRRVTDLTMSLHVVNGCPCAIISMPKPERSPQAYFVGVVLLTSEIKPASWSRDLGARVFTMENTRDQLAVVCELKSDNSRKHHGRVGSPDISSFLKILATLLPHIPPLPGAASSSSSATSPVAEMPVAIATPAKVKPTTPPTTVPKPESVRQEQALTQMLDHPHFVADPVYPAGDYLAAFGAFVFRFVLTQTGRTEMIATITTSNSSKMMVMLIAGNVGCWTIDLEQTSEQGMSGKKEFIDRVKDPIRRPPLEMAAFTAEQHIVARGVSKIQIADGEDLPGQYQICSLKTIGWYVAVLMSSPNAKK